MKWIKNWLGLSTPLDKKKRLSNLQVKAAILVSRLEEVEDEIIELLNRSD